MRIYIFLAIGLVAASQSGNIIRIGDAHPVAIAAWRLLLASLLSYVRHRGMNRPTKKARAPISKRGPYFEP
ncbi:MAG: hypothetical protein V3T05_13745 [Myxococcota bacterium]